MLSLPHTPVPMTHVDSFEYGRMRAHFRTAPRHPIGNLIYIVTYNDEVIYVGKATKGIVHRFTMHKTMWSKFIEFLMGHADSVIHVYLVPSHLAETENALIKYYQPRCNTIGK